MRVGVADCVWPQLQRVGVSKATARKMCTAEVDTAGSDRRAGRSAVVFTAPLGDRAEAERL